MAEFIVNPRRAPRAPARCRAAVSWAGGEFEAETEDISSRGCQVVSPTLVSPGDILELLFACAQFPEPLRVAGRVCWVSEHKPWRVGIAFDEAYVPSAERWFDKLVAASPGLCSFRRVPERIPVEAMVYLGPPPRFLVDFTASEASLLRAIASGARIDELQARQRDRWPEAQRALFSLLARQAVTLSRGQSAHPDAWKKILTEVEASLAIESLGTGPIPVAATRSRSEPPPEPEAVPLPLRPLGAPLPSPRGQHGANPAASPWGAPARDPSREVDLGGSGPNAGVGAIPPPRGAGRSEYGAGWATPRPAPGSAGDLPLDRDGEADALYDRALAEIENGSIHGAMALLRKALTLAPGDPDITAALAKLAARDRARSSR